MAIYFMYGIHHSKQALSGDGPTSDFLQRLTQPTKRARSPSSDEGPLSPTSESENDDEGPLSPTSESENDDEGFQSNLLTSEDDAH